jgi:hypothetical protein
MKFFITLFLLCFATNLSAQHKTKTKQQPKSPKTVAQQKHTPPKAALNSQKIKLPDCFYKRIEGKVGTQKVIEMDLVKIDSFIKGTYYYKNNINPLELTGIVDSEGNITINELGRYDLIKEQYPIMATFKGVFQTEKLIKGEFTRIKNDSVYPFELKEVYQAGSGQFDLVRKQKTYQNCGDGGMCADFTLIYPQMKKGVAQDKINKQIMSVVLAHYAEKHEIKINSLDALIEDFMTRYKAEEKNFAQLDASTKPAWKHYNEIQVIFNASNIIGLQFHSEVAESGAKPVEFIEYANFDLTDGQPLKLDNIFKEGYKPQLTTIAEELFRKHYGFNSSQNLNGFQFKNGVFELNNNFTVNKKGIIFRYNPYEIASMSMGSPQIFIPFDQIRGLVNWDSPLGKLLNE